MYKCKFLTGDAKKKGYQFGAKFVVLEVGKEYPPEIVSLFTGTAQNAFFEKVKAEPKKAKAKD